MPAGELRRGRVGFYKRASVGASPDYGVVESEFPDEPEFTCQAKLQPKLGGEGVLATRLTGTNLVNVTVRQFASTRVVTTAWKLRDEKSGDDYNIRSIIDPFMATAKAGRWFEMLCEKGVAP